MIDGRNFFDQPIKNDKEHIKTFKKLQLAKEMITQLVVCKIKIISKSMIK